MTITDIEFSVFHFEMVIGITLMGMYFDNLHIAGGLIFSFGFVALLISNR